MSVVKDSEYGTKYPHFQKKEFVCKHCKSIGKGMDANLLQLLEKLREKLNASSCNIYSGYRCSVHDKSVGGSGNGPHVNNFAVDCYFLDKNKKIGYMLQEDSLFEWRNVLNNCLLGPEINKNLTKDKKNELKEIKEESYGSKKRRTRKGS